MKKTTLSVPDITPVDIIKSPRSPRSPSNPKKKASPAIASEGPVQFYRGDQVKVIGTTRAKGATAIVLDADCNGFVKVFVNDVPLIHATRNFQRAELELVPIPKDLLMQQLRKSRAELSVLKVERFSFERIVQLREHGSIVMTVLRETFESGEDLLREVWHAWGHEKLKGHIRDVLQRQRSAEVTHHQTKTAHEEAEAAARASQATIASLTHRLRTLSEDSALREEELEKRLSQAEIKYTQVENNWQSLLNTLKVTESKMPKASEILATLARQRSALQASRQEVITMAHVFAERLRGVSAKMTALASENIYLRKVTGNTRGHATVVPMSGSSKSLNCGESGHASLAVPVQMSDYVPEVEAESHEPGRHHHRKHHHSHDGEHRHDGKHHHHHHDRDDPSQDSKHHHHHHHHHQDSKHHHHDSDNHHHHHHHSKHHRHRADSDHQQADRTSLESHEF